MREKQNVCCKQVIHILDVVFGLCSVSNVYPLNFSCRSIYDQNCFIKIILIALKMIDWRQNNGLETWPSLLFLFSEL